MSSLDIRNNSAVMKRAEQLKRWEESDTNREPPTPRPEKGRKIKFSSGCVFLAACLAGDKEEVVKLIDSGADINTANVDGLTALHQACIDDNLEMVEFLIEHGADINRQDNEGWTPLIATASCGFVSIARYLVEHGADVSAVNSDGDLAVDLAVNIQHMGMIDFMQKMVAEHNIDCEKARQAEEQQMLNDAKKWLRSDAAEVDRPHPKTGATALHVSAAKGYTKVLSLLLAGRANVDKQDNDGWTPLHAAAHWGQKEAAEMLVDAMADMDVRNYAGQSCIDVAERKMVKFLEELRANNKRTKRRPSSQISSRISDTIENHIENTPTKIIRVEVRPDQSKDQANDEKPKLLADSYKSQMQADSTATEEEAPWRRNSLATRTRGAQPESPAKNQVPDKDVKTTTATTEPSDVILRRTQSFENDQKKPASSAPASPPIAPTTAATATTATTVTTTTTPVRRSFVPPVRDEESETQRKAHAKRVRETRRSTQGVTLDEIKSAEELVKKKNSNMNINNNNNNNNNSSNNDTQIPTTTTITTISSQQQQQLMQQEQQQEQQPPPPTSPLPLPITRTITAVTNAIDTVTTTITSPTTSKSEQKQQHVPFTINTTVDEKNNEVNNEDDDDDDITATFTIVAPIAKRRTSTNKLQDDDDDGDGDQDISATFTMTSRRDSRTPTPTPTIEADKTMVETTILVTPPEITIDEPQEEAVAEVDEKEQKQAVEEQQKPQEHDAKLFALQEISTSLPPSSSSSSTSASEEETQNTENESNNETDNDLEALTKTATPTVLSATQKAEDLKAAKSEMISARSGITFVPLPLQAHQQQQQPTTSSSATSTSTPTPTPTLDSPVRLREKRSLFDLDNASSLTLAEKLRNEANKYSYEDRSFKAITDPAAASASDSDRDSVFSNYSRRSLDSSPLHMTGSGGVSGAGGSGASNAERRPSWRLKFDAGCKVC